MISRRRVLTGTPAAVLAAFARTRARAPSQSTAAATPVAFDVPAGACDCHTHVFGDPTRFPFAGGPTYTPPPASPQALRALHETLGIDRVVIVQPSVYGTDNACTLDGVRQIGASARAIVVIDDSTADAALDAMHERGARGLRLNLATFGQTDPAAARARLERAAERAAPRGWHIQIFTQLTVIEGIGDAVRAARVPVVFDHFGGAQAVLGVRQPGFDVLVDLVRSGQAYVKISAAYRSSDRAPDYPDVAPLARALVDANAERVLWGSDWPHPGPRPPGRPLGVITQPYDIDNGIVLNQLAAWVPDPAVRRTILADNPARLYGFERPGEPAQA